MRMRADMSVGSLLSGGLDSSAVLGMASRYTDKTLTAFNIAFDHHDYEESVLARETAVSVGANFRPVSFNDADYTNAFADSVWHAETAQYNLHGTARFLLSREIQHSNFKVVLAGEGAAELFVGYDFCRASLLANATDTGLAQRLGMLCRLLQPHNQLERQLGHISPWLIRMSRVLSLPASLLNRLADKLDVLSRVLAPDFYSEFQHHDPYRIFFHGFNRRTQFQGKEPAKQILYVWLKSIFVNYLLAADRVDIAHGVEVRLPFLDHKLFEYASQIPVSLLAKGSNQSTFCARQRAPSSQTVHTGG